MTDATDSDIVANYIASRQKEAKRALRARLEPEERLLAWLSGQSHPSAVIPVMSPFHRISTPFWLIGLTSTRLVLLEHAAVSFRRIKKQYSIPLGKIRRLEAKSWLFYRTLTVVTPSFSLSLRVMEDQPLDEFVRRLDEVSCAPQPAA